MNETPHFIHLFINTRVHLTRNGQLLPDTIAIDLELLLAGLRFHERFFQLCNPSLALVSVHSHLANRLRLNEWKNKSSCFTIRKLRFEDSSEIVYGV